MASFEEHEFTYTVANEALKTFYVAAGPADGPLIVFVHGWPGIGKTWHHQLRAFAGLGFRVVAPDMIGYGRSSAPKKQEAYSLERINLSMLALLRHLGRSEACWVGHDWGCGAVYSFAEHYPEHSVAVCGMTLPVHSIELGLEELVKHVNRKLYPAEEFPYGQWDYQRFYELHFDKATAWFDKGIAAFLRVAFVRGSPEGLDKPAVTSRVLADGGWFGGAPEPDPNWKHIPIEYTCVDEQLYQELVTAMTKTGFFGGNAWYSHHARNREYFFKSAKDDGYLRMPVLFIDAKFDGVCDMGGSTLTEPQRRYCTNLKELSIEAGHWVPLEKPEEVNAALAKWLEESCKHYWPGQWTAGVTRPPTTT